MFFLEQLVLLVGLEFLTNYLPRWYFGLTHNLNLAECTLEAHIFLWKVVNIIQNKTSAISEW